MKLKQFPIQFVPPSTLKPYFRNVKIHDKQNVAKIASLISTYDFDQPIVVDADKVIIKGHGRYMAALYAGKKMVPIIVRDDLTKDEARASRIADNRTFDLGEIDYALAKSEVMDFVGSGGKGAEALFDFAKPAKMSGSAQPTMKVEVSGVGAPPKDVPPGEMLVCPACDYTFWEMRE